MGAKIKGDIARSLRNDISSGRRLRNDRGQAVIELAFSLPFLIWLIYYTVNAFYAIHTSHVAQKYAAMNVWQRIDSRSKFLIDDVEGRATSVEHIAVQYTDSGGNVIARKINAGRILILNTIGVCREPGCD